MTFDEKFGDGASYARGANAESLDELGYLRKKIQELTETLEVWKRENERLRSFLEVAKSPLPDPVPDTCVEGGI